MYFFDVESEYEVGFSSTFTVLANKVQLCSKKFNHTPKRILSCITSKLMF